MLKQERNAGRDEDAARFNRRFRQAIIAYAVIEFIAIAILVYYKATR